MKFFRLRKLRKKGMSSSISRKTDEQRRLRNILNTSTTIKVAIGVAVFALVVMCITMFGRYYYLGVTVGFRADLDYYNSFEFSYPDPKRTEQEREEAARNIPDIYRFEKNELERDLSMVIADIGEWLGERKNLEEAEAPPTQEALDSLREKYEKKIKDYLPRRLSEGNISVITTLDKPLEGMKKISNIVQGFFEDRMILSNRPVSADGLGITLKPFTQIRNEVLQAVHSAFKEAPEDEMRKLLQIPFFFIDKSYINQIYIYEDTETRERLQKAAEESVKTQYRTARRGSTIVSSGTVIQRDHLVQLRENRARSDAIKSSGEKAVYYLTVSVIVLILFIIFVSYLKLYQPHILDSNARLVPFGLVIFLTLAFSRVFINFKPTHPFFDYPVFVSFAAVLMSIMFGANLAFATSLILATLVGILFDFSLLHGLLALVVGIAAAHLARNVRRRSELIRVSFIIGGVNFVLVFAISSATNMGVALTQLWQCMGGFTFGIVGAALAAISLPVFEYTFKITTNISLMELTDTKNPLLRRLVMETPGTYHHSLVVGNLAEAAAESVGANALLARVAAYYHDIGKLKKPEYFSENEQFTKSKHDSLIPSMSSLIITSHVKDGVDLAIKHKLNREIIDVIKQHHGTGLVYYFYKRALELVDDPDSLDDSDFRYPGPKPQSKEAAILMLADAVEAASRSLDRVSTSKLRSLVHEIITGRFNEGQFDECEVTLQDLHRIEETFVHILMGSLHQRVKYPKEGEKTIPADSQLQEEARNDRGEEQPRFIKH